MATAVVERVCAHPTCDEPVVGGPPSKRYCTERCRKRAEHQRLGAKAQAQRRCKNCDRPFAARRQQVYCSTECHAQAKTFRFLKHTSCPLNWTMCHDCEHIAPVRHLIGGRCQPCATRYRATKGPAPGWRAVLTADPCPYCGGREAMTVDHIVPVSRSGEDDPGNWAGCCQRCNGQKGTLPLLGYLLWRQLRSEQTQIDRVQAMRRL